MSDVIDTEEGWYVVQYATDYDEEATEENLEALRRSQGFSISLSLRRTGKPKRLLRWKRTSGRLFR
ncbi:MAG: hypothetical protein V8Q27_00550 [Eubacteriales bacterium]